MVMPTTLSGIRMAGPETSFGVSVNLNVLLYDNVVGRSLILRKIRWRNNNAAAGVLRIGTGVVGAAGITDLVPPITIPANLDGELEEGAIPALPAGAGVDIVGQASVGAADPNDVEVQIEIEVFGA